MSGVAQYAAMLHPGDAETPPMSRSPSPYSSTLPKDASTSKVKTKKKRKSKKFEEGLRELRRRTREGVWQKRKDEEHKHVFGVVEKGADGVGKQVCHECGFTIDVEEF